MEKFAVDLEKVLDEFEFSEEREEQDTTPAIKNQPLPHLGLCQIPSRPPAASYRRPSFEPINLSEADFAASPPSVTPNFDNDTLIKQNLSRDSSIILQNGRRNKSFIAPSSSRNNSGSSSIVNSKDVVETGQELKSDDDDWSGRDSPRSTDEKPDLLEYKSNDYLKDVILPPQLPDVTTSVWSLPHGLSSSFNEPLKNAPLCDLIHSSNGILYDHIKHNASLENVSTDSIDNHKNSQLNSEVINDSLERAEDKQIQVIPTSGSCILNSGINSDGIQDNLNLTKGQEYGIRTDNFSKVPKTVEIRQDKDDNSSQNLPSEDMYRTLDKEAVNNNKKEISGSLNMLHQTTEFQSKNPLLLNNDSDKPKNEFSNPSEAIESSNVNSDVNVKSFSRNSSSSNVNTNDKKARINESGCNQYMDTKETEQFKTSADKTLPNSPEFINNTNNYQQTKAENQLCHKNQETKPIGFTSNNNVTDSELQQYLNELEDTHGNELCLNSEQSDISTKESSTEINNKAFTVSEYKNDLEQKYCNTNRKDKNVDLSMQLSDHISGVECISQPTYVDMNPQLSSVVINDDNRKLSSLEVKKELDSCLLAAKENVRECENDDASEQVLDRSKTFSTNNPVFQNMAPVAADNIIKEGVLEDTKNNNSCLRKLNKCEDEVNNESKMQKYNPSNENISHESESESSETFQKEGTNIGGNLIKCSELLNESKLTNDMSSNFSRQEDNNSEYSLTEDVSSDSENSSGCKRKVIKYTDVFDNEDVQNDIEKESIVDCDSLMSQESLEEDSFSKPLNVFDANKIQSFDSPSPSSNGEYDSAVNVSAKMIPIKNGVECKSQTSIDEAAIPAEEDKPSRPNSLELPARITVDSEETSTVPLSPTISGELDLSPEERRLGKIAPVWVPDSDAQVCMQCQVRFTVLKRRHHCRACGQVLCSKCCGLKARLEFCGYSEVRVCQPCFSVLETVNGTDPRSPLGRQPNPNNPMEYCSKVPPLQQVAGSLHQPPPSVMVPVGVLKREGRSKSDVTKQVMFSDGIRPGGDLTELDGSGEPRIPFRRPGRQTKRVGTPPGGPISSNSRRALDPHTQSFIPKDGETSLPPIVTYGQGELMYTDYEQPMTLNEGPYKFAVNRNLNVHIKRVLLDCCVNRECWCISSEGLSCVGQDEIVFLLECLPQETLPPKDIFLLINSLYQNAGKGTTVSEMSFTPASSNKLLGSRDHGGFLYIRPSYQCTAQLILPPPPYLFALLIHRWETQWARLFPIRLVLRLGAEFRYYPCPLVSVRHRAPLYTDIGHTIINLLADFRKYSYTLPTVRGLVIHMEDRQTSILLPRNRYDQVVRALNNSNDSVLAFGANFSLAADSHLVCMQSTEDDNTSYHTQAINIHNKPRRVTGASFVVFNGALKTPGLAGKSNIVEDGLMVQVPSETMIALRAALRDMHDYAIGCGPHAEETVLLQWTVDDTNFNVGVKSCIDGRPLDGVPSIRVHSGTDYTGSSRLIRWTEVFILQSDERTDHTGEPLDISRLSGSIAQATCLALVPLLDLLSAASLTTIAVRANIHPENVGYEAGGNGEKLPPFYMKSLDDELVAVVHQAALAAENTPATLELVFRIMEQG